MSVKLPAKIKFATNVRFQNTRLIDENGVFHDSITINDAVRMANNLNLDLVCLEFPNANMLAFCKIIDFGKFMYNQEKNTKKQKNNTKKEAKEMRFSPDIADHDISYKVKQINDFLKGGSDVTLSMKMSGRQKLHFNEAEAKLNGIIALCSNGVETGRTKSDGLITVKLTKVK